MLRFRFLVICLLLVVVLPSAFAQPFLHFGVSYSSDGVSPYPNITPTALTNVASSNASGAYVTVTGRLAVFFRESASYYLLGHGAPIELILDNPVGELYRYSGTNIVVSGWWADQNEKSVLHVESWTPAKSPLLNKTFSGISGTLSTITILVEFSDNTASHPPTYFQSLVYDQMNSYYIELSYNSIQIVGTVTSQWYKLSHPTSYYQVSGYSSTFEEYLKLASDVVALVDPYVNFALYQHYILVFAGSWVWGARASGLGISTNDGVIVDSATFQQETYLMPVFAHEFGHDLGLPDLYDYASKDPYAFVDGWDPMSIQNAQHLSSWSKIKLGWIQPSQIRTFTGGTLTTTIERLEFPTTGYDALKIQTSTNIYFLVETRQRIGYDINLPPNAPDHGVLITVIDETKESGQGIVRLIDANPTTKSYWDGDAVWQVGQTYTNPVYGFSISIQSWTGAGFTVKVSTGHISSFATDIAQAPIKSAYFVYPDYQGQKPSGVGYAELSDWTATGFILGMCANPQYEITDTNSSIIDTNTGEVKLSNSKIILFGGPLVNTLVHNYEANRAADVYWQNEGGIYYWHLGNGTRLDATAMPATDVSHGQDMFIVESFTDTSGNTVYVVYGYGWKGTFAGGKFLKFVIYPNIASYTGSCYIFKWTDANGDGFVDLQEISATPIAQG